MSHFSSRRGTFLFPLIVNVHCWYLLLVSRHWWVFNECEYPQVSAHLCQHAGLVQMWLQQWIFAGWRQALMFTWYVVVCVQEKDSLHKWLYVSERTCNKNNGGCSHTCVDSSNGAICSCPRGYHLGSDRMTCEGISTASHVVPPFLCFLVFDCLPNFCLSF